MSHVKYLVIRSTALIAFISICLTIILLLNPSVQKVVVQDIHLDQVRQHVKTWYTTSKNAESIYSASDQTSGVSRIHFHYPIPQNIQENILRFLTQTERESIYFHHRPSSKGVLISHKGIDVLDKLLLHPQVYSISNVLSQEKVHPILNSPSEISSIIVHFISPDIASEAVVDIASKSPSLQLVSLSEKFARASFKLPTEQVARTIELLSHSHFVVWIEPEVNFQTLNHYSSFVVQSKFQNKTLLWDHGITGKSEIIAHGDSGVDYDMCFFHDPDHEIPLETINLQHRKVVTYKRLSEKDSGKDFHGTHTAASVAGNVLYPQDSEIENQLRPFNGMAPDAKLAIYDLGSDGNINIGDNLYTKLFQTQYNDTSARISSNSWGGPASKYDYPSLDSDSFMWDHPDFLIVYAAGNSGISTHGHYKIATPGQSKNALTVGSSTNAENSFIDGGKLCAFQLIDEINNVESTIRFRIYNVVAPIVQNSFSGGKLTVVSCKQIKHAILSKIVLFVDAEHDPECFQAILEMKDSDISVALVPESSSHSIQAISSSKFVFGSVMQKDALLLEKKSQMDSVLVDFPVAIQSKIFRKHTLSSFSSRGPTNDGRIKPDILGPGHYVTSALSDGDLGSFQCNGYNSLQAKQGTSMASAIVAAHASLVREYFTQGRYPSGSESPQDSLVPQGSLIKAIFINSGTSVHSVDVTSASMEIPSFHQGFGESILENTLYFKDESTHTLFAKGDQNVSMQAHQSFCFEVLETSKIPLKVTLAWTDPPADISADQVLVNNLDLSVFDKSVGKFHGGNMNDLGNSWDQLNNVEQVMINDPAPGMYIATVHGTHVPNGVQPFSLVATGNFKFHPKSECQNHIGCKNDCSRHGVCENGICKCDDKHFGADCKQRISDLNLKTNLKSFSIGQGEWQYFKFINKENVKGTIDVSLSVYIETGDDTEFIVLAQSKKIPTFYSHFPIDSENYLKSRIQTKLSFTMNDTRDIYYIGVYLYCCSDSTLRITSQYDLLQEPDSVTDVQPGLIVGSVIFMAIVSGISFQMIRKYKTARFQRVDSYSESENSLISMQDIGDISDDRFA